MIEEFEKLTGFYPTAEHYAAIEDAYQSFGGDKDVFCFAYKKNLNGIAEAIAQKVSIGRIIADNEIEKEISDLKGEIKRLRAILGRELEQ